VSASYRNAFNLFLKVLIAEMVAGPSDFAGGGPAANIEDGSSLIIKV